MKSLFKSSLMSLLLALSFLVFAGEGDVAKVIILKGTVKVKLKNNKIITIKKGDWLPEGVQIKTEAKSFVKLLFIDKSQMNLGPNSQMIINKFPKKKAGIITLMKGQLRSKVTKDYMQMNKNREKLYIKTRTAAMGVRGTDFEVGYHNGVTTTNLYEGALVVTALEGNVPAADMAKIFEKQSKLTPISAGQMAVFKGGKAPPSVLKIPENIMREAVKSGVKGGNLKTLSNDSTKISGNNLLLPGTKKNDVANNSAGIDSGIGGGVIVADREIASPEDEEEGEDKPDGPDEPENQPLPVPNECPLSGCSNGPYPGPDDGPDGPYPGPDDGPGPLPEDPCVLDPGLCEIGLEDGDICALNPELPQCGGGATSTNVQFNFSTQ